MLLYIGVPVLFLAWLVYAARQMSRLNSRAAQLRSTDSAGGLLGPLIRKLLIATGLFLLLGFLLYVAAWYVGR